MIKQYASANAFRAALEERLKNISKKQGTDIQRLRRQVAFDRLLCRLFKKNSGDLFLKGGYSMELRVHMARTTKDIDLVLKARKIADHAEQDQEILDILQEAVRKRGQVWTPDSRRTFHRFPHENCPVSRLDPFLPS